MSNSLNNFGLDDVYELFPDLVSDEKRHREGEATVDADLARMVQGPDFMLFTDPGVSAARIADVRTRRRVDQSSHAQTVSADPSGSSFLSIPSGYLNSQSDRDLFDRVSSPAIVAMPLIGGKNSAELPAAAKRHLQSLELSRVLLASLLANQDGIPLRERCAEGGGKTKTKEKLRLLNDYEVAEVEQRARFDEPSGYRVLIHENGKYYTPVLAQESTVFDNVYLRTSDVISGSRRLILGCTEGSDTIITNSEVLAHNKGIDVREALGIVWPLS